MADKEIIIVTGSSGRIGTNVVRRLGEKYRIIGFELVRALYASANEELVPVDLSSDESVVQAFTHIRLFYGNRIACVIHLAAYYSFEKPYSEKYEQVTVKGTERLLKALQGFEVEQFIFSSTMLVHAPCKVGELINEESLVDPSWGYPLSKVRTERLIHELRGSIPILILRIAGVYDDRCHSIPISEQIQRIYEKQLEAHFFPGDIRHGASFLHMQDLVNAIALAIEKRKTLPEKTTLLLGEPKTLSYDYLQRSISKLLYNKEFRTYRIPKWIGKMGAWVLLHLPLGHKFFIKPWMIDIADAHYALDISKAKKILDWQPNTSLEETLPKMLYALRRDPVAWYKENGLPLPRFLKEKV